MIVNFDNKFVFIKTKKVGGTYVEVALRNICFNQKDIITPILPKDEIVAIQMGLLSRNYAVNKADEATYAELIMRRKYDEAGEFFKKTIVHFNNHTNVKKFIKKSKIINI